MSRLIKKTIPIPQGATLTMNGSELLIKGPKGEAKFPIPQGAVLKIESDMVTVTSAEGAKTTAAAGTAWALVRNHLEGVTDGFKKVLEIEGVGYGAQTEGKELVLRLGYALPVRLAIPPAVTVTTEKNVITVTGIDKDAVGQAAAEIRALKKPEPYKGKGIKYQGEVIRRKVGKKAGATAA